MLGLVQYAAGRPWDDVVSAPPREYTVSLDYTPAKGKTFADHIPICDLSIHCDVYKTTPLDRLNKYLHVCLFVMPEKLQCPSWLRPLRSGGCAPVRYRFVRRQSQKCWAGPVKYHLTQTQDQHQIEKLSLQMPITGTN